jgi:hypothetical protein
LPAGKPSNPAGCWEQDPVMGDGLAGPLTLTVAMAPAGQVPPFTVHVIEMPPDDDVPPDEPDACPLEEPPDDEPSQPWHASYPEPSPRQTWNPVTAPPQAHDFWSPGAQACPPLDDDDDPPPRAHPASATERPNSDKQSVLFMRECSSSRERVVPRDVDARMLDRPARPVSGP